MIEGKPENEANTVISDENQATKAYPHLEITHNENGGLIVSDLQEPSTEVHPHHVVTGITAVEEVVVNSSQNEPIIEQIVDTKVPDTSTEEVGKSDVYEVVISPQFNNVLGPKDVKGEKEQDTTLISYVLSEPESSKENSDSQNVFTKSDDTVNIDKNVVKDSQGDRKRKIVHFKSRFQQERVKSSKDSDITCDIQFAKDHSGAIDFDTIGPTKELMVPKKKLKVESSDISFQLTLPKSKNTRGTVVKQEWTENVDILKIKKGRGKSKDKRMCNLCGSNHTDLHGHMLDKHATIKKGGFQCNLCELVVYRDIYTFNEHLKSHSDATHCLCTICGEAFKRPAQLKSHLEACHFDEVSYNRFGCIACNTVTSIFDLQCIQILAIVL